MEPILCANGCGFFGTAPNRNMCSKCYKDFLKRAIIHMRDIIDAREKPVATIDQHDHASSSPSAKNDVDVAEITAQLEDLTVRKSRCKSCNKKVGLIGFKCRCGDLFCGRHRLPEAHACNMDYKTLPARNDKDLSEIVKADKLEARV